MRACIDQNLCIGCGLCVSAAPDVFEMNPDGKAVAVADTTEANKDSVRSAIDGCPVSAISQGE